MNMNKGQVIGVGAGVGVAVVVIVIVVIVVIVCYRFRRNRAVLRKRATLRMEATVNTTHITAVESAVNYRISRDAIVATAGDRNQESVQGLRTGEHEGAKAFPPPVNVQPPPVPRA